jgi:hypothetical protein
MSNYYTQGQQPGPINFSSWSETEGHNVVPSQPFNSDENENSPVLAPVQVAQVQSPQSQQIPFSDPNATRLLRENFRSAQDNAIVINSSTNSSKSSTSDSDNDSHYEYIKYIIGAVVGLVIIGGGIYLYQHRNQNQSSILSTNEPMSSTFGSGLLQDLEFL